MSLPPDQSIEPDSPPEISTLGLNLETLLDLQALQVLLELFHKLTRAAIAVLDLRGRVLLAVGWQPVCTQFHRIHPETSQNCLESDLFLAGNVKAGECVAYPCKNGLWDVVTPFCVEGVHVGNIYTGQFFYEDQEIDLQAFAARAEAYGLDMEAYLSAVARVPRRSRDWVNSLMGFLVHFAAMVSEQALSNRRLNEVTQAQAQALHELSRLEEERHLSEARLEMAFNASPIGLVLVSLEGRFMTVNPAFCAMVGRTEAELLGATFQDITHPEDVGFNIQFAQELLEGRQKTVQWEKRYLRKDGQEIWAQVHTSLVRAMDGTPLHYVTQVQDLTQRKQSEREQLLLRAQLVQTQKMESLAGGVSHDMNNVLMAIQTLATLHQATAPEGSKLCKDMETITKACQRGGTMLKGLLGFARQNLAEEREVDLNALVREELALLERTTLQKVHLDMDLEEGLRPIKGDPAALLHGLMNLCVNAVDAMDKDGILTLRTRNEPGGMVLLEVADTGTGMPKEVLDRVLEPFFTTKPQGKGTGLGLSIVYGTVKAHHGTLNIQSQPGQGTRVSLHFPAIEAKPSLPEVGAQAVSPPPSASLRVLLVDDDELIQIAVQALLEALGHTVISALSGEEALARLETGLHTDVVILDMNMPGLGGAGTLPRLRRLRPSLPVLLATGRVDQTALSLASEYEGVTLLSKPFSLADLQTSLASIVRE